MQLILSLFPGADLFGMAFEQEGFCVVRGPDKLLGNSILNFHVPEYKFDGIIGGPPCQPFSNSTIGQTASSNNLVSEFTRIVKEARPKWYVMENVCSAPKPNLEDCRDPIAINAWDVGALQYRVRSFWSNLSLIVNLLPEHERVKNPWPTVLASEYKYSSNSADKRRAGRKVGRKMTLEEVNIVMGLPKDFETPALTQTASYEVRGNGVPLQMGKAIARTVKSCIHF